MPPTSSNESGELELDPARTTLGTLRFVFFADFVCARFLLTTGSRARCGADWTGAGGGGDTGTRWGVKAGDGGGAGGGEAGWTARLDAGGTVDV